MSILRKKPSFRESHARDVLKKNGAAPRRRLFCVSAVRRGRCLKEAALCAQLSLMVVTDMGEMVTLCLNAPE